MGRGRISLGCTDLYGKQIDSLHHHHSEMMTTFDRRFISIETHSDDIETRLQHDAQALSLHLDRHDERFTQFVESHAHDHCEMMTCLRSSFPPPAP